MQLVSEIGDRLEVVMIPKVEGPWDIHFVDQLLAQLEEAGIVELNLIAQDTTRYGEDLGMRRHGLVRQFGRARVQTELLNVPPMRISSDSDSTARSRTGNASTVTSPPGVVYDPAFRLPPGAARR